MQTTIFGTCSVVTVLTVIASSVLSGCNKMSESVLVESAGINGGFEITQSGLPVNWLVYTPETIPTGDYDLIIDTGEYRAGKQSLKFVVRECSPDGGWRSPGFSKEYEATAGVTYTVGFWVKNDGAEFRVRIGGVSATEGRYETIVQSADTIATWRYYEHKYRMPPEFDRIRFELNILRPGTFWIDEVTIRGISDG
ncbi:MAG: carbohydrate binding domain-containing protein [Acidobacteria bacterium]|nr:carbohydrate binding domain-containing protein [Acidobacteriota bacterium]